ncbi:MAG: hypothetical protein E7200_05145 [Selenomonas ruminantium]|nr:hypothetical protein [Selenomonas ruminantium]
MSRFAFRAWDTQEKRMLLQTDIPALSVQELFCSGRYIAMQWIGEYDKHRTPIYEGDCISYPIQSEEKLYTVAWDVRQASFKAVPTDKENKVAPGLNPGTTKSLTVTGNIHGNNYDDMRAAMRRFKFRVWGDEQKIMLPWEELRELSAQELFSLENCAVMQWTGCRSSRGEPIYEGDIVVNLKDKKEEPYIIYWSGGLAGFSAKPIYPGTYIAPSLGSGSESVNKLVIVGNVKQHPDIARYQTLESIYSENAPPLTQSKYNLCPFCESDNVDLECDDGIWYVQCEDCGAQGGTAYMPENAITMWNNANRQGGGEE